MNARSWASRAAALLITSVSVSCCLAQSNKQQAPGNANGQGSPSASLQGLSYSKEDWPKQLTLPDKAKVKKIAVICYELVYTNSGVQPLVLEPRTDLVHSDGTKVPCRVVDEKHPLMMDELLVVAVDFRQVDIARIKILNINITNQQGSPINPAPIRPSFGASTPATNLPEDRIYFLTWPNRLPGDVIPTISINAVYTPPSPGSAWEANTFYQAGSLVTTGMNDGHYFATVAGGVSGSDMPTWKFNTPAIVPDHNVTWQYMSASLPSGLQPKAWAPNMAYDIGNVILSPTNGNYYVAISTVADQKSGNTLPAFTVSAAVVTQEDPVKQQPKTTETNTNIQWQAVGKRNPQCKKGSTEAEPWVPNMDYKANQIICDPTDGEEYKALVNGTSGTETPIFNKTVSIKYSIRWTDLGFTAPQTVASGQPADQTVSLINLQLPQSHSLSYYNLSFGVVVSSVKNRTFGFATQPGSSTSSGVPIQTGSTPLVDPVLMFTAYPKPIDAERHWRPMDLIPGVSFGLSLSSPASNFYFGLSSEVLRNVQIVYGFNVAKVPNLASGIVPSSSTSPATVQRFDKGGFGGLTFNISGFIQTLFGGGGGGGGKSSQTGQPSQTGQ